MQDQKKVILITEDEPPMLRILTDTFLENGFTTIQARNGKEGLIMAKQHHPDLILLDILMPQMDGLAMMEELRKDSWGKTVPVILLTNVSPDSDVILQSIVKHQPAYYFVKSDVKLEDIVEKIKAMTSSTTAQTSAMEGKDALHTEEISTTEDDKTTS